MTVGTTFCLQTSLPPCTETEELIIGLPELRKCNQFLKTLGQDSRNKAWMGPGRKQLACTLKKKKISCESQKKKAEEMLRLKETEEAGPLNAMHDPPLHFGPGGPRGEGKDCHKEYDWGKWQNLNMESILVR